MHWLKLVTTNLWPEHGGIYPRDTGRGYARRLPAQSSRIDGSRTAKIKTLPRRITKERHKNRHYAHVSDSSRA